MQLALFSGLEGPAEKLHYAFTAVSPPLGLSILKVVLTRSGCSQQVSSTSCPGFAGWGAWVPLLEAESPSRHERGSLPQFPHLKNKKTDPKCKSWSRRRGTVG